ncbi:hypothetical protein ABT264_19300 [Streptomyces virginiae]|uniref:hypothetical protein n=1 Tax=Streptomyces virginiae TaxID=1961 RepID=UPI0033335086
MTGPQRTPDERGTLAELAGAYAALLVAVHCINWASVQALYRLPEWDACPLGVADVALADALCIPMVDLTA